MTTQTRHCGVFALVTCLIGLASANSYAATLEEAVKAGFVYNFTKFVQWPASAHASTQAAFDLCVTGQDALVGSLEALYGKTANQKPIVIRRDIKPEDYAQCDILYIASRERRVVQTSLTAAYHLPVLTISDYPDFIQAGGMIGLRRVADHVGFEINIHAAHGCGLQISAQLLKLAKTVKVTK